MESDRNSSWLATALAVVGILAAVGGAVVSVPQLSWGPAIICILITGLLLEIFSVPVAASGYHSLGTAVVMLSLFVQGVPSDPKSLLSSVGLCVATAGICGLGRFFGPEAEMPHPPSRTAGYGFNVLKVGLASAAVGGVLFAKLGLLVAAAAGFAICLGFDLGFSSFLIGQAEDSENGELWSRVPAEGKVALATPVIVGVAGGGLVQSDIQQSLLIVVGLAAVGMAYRSVAKYYIEEIQVKDQRILENENLRLNHESERLEEQLSSVQAKKKLADDEVKRVYSWAESLGESTKVEETMNVVSYMAKTLRIPYRSFAIFLNLGDRLTAVYKETSEEIDKMLSMSHLLNLEEAVIKKVWQSGKHQFQPRMQTSVESRIFKDEQSCICVPLLVSKEPIGVIYMGSLKPDTHKQEHLKALKMVATLAAPSIKTARLFEENEKRLRTEQTARQGVEAKNAQLAQLQVMGQKMGATLNTDTTIKVVAEALLKMTPAQSVILFTPDRAEDADDHAWKAEFAHTPYDMYVRNLALRDDEGILGRTIQTGRTLLIRNMANSDLRSLLGAENSVALAPLYASASESEEDGEQELLGCLYVGAASENALTEDHGNLVETVSYQTAMALKNARLYEQTQQQALTDGLTGLFTHRLFQETLEQELEEAAQTKQPLVLCMVDCDNFKTFNDTLGHPAGDALLKDIASLLKDKVRPMDIVARYGGDEFAMLLRNTTKEEAVRICERVREAFLLRFGGAQVQVTSSIGVACYPVDAITKKDLSIAADDALYVAKRGGRNRVSASKTLSERSVKPVVQEVLARN